MQGSIYHNKKKNIYIFDYRFISTTQQALQRGFKQMFLVSC